MVNMAGWPIPWWARRFKDSDRASGLLAGCFQCQGIRPRDRSTLARPEDDAHRSGSLLSLPSRFLVHRCASSPLELRKLLLFYPPDSLELAYAEGRIGAWPIASCAGHSGSGEEYEED